MLIWLTCKYEKKENLSKSVWKALSPGADAREPVEQAGCRTCLCMHFDEGGSIMPIVSIFTRCVLGCRVSSVTKPRGFLWQSLGHCESQFTTKPMVEIMMKRLWSSLWITSYEEAPRTHPIDVSSIYVDPNSRQKQIAHSLLVLRAL